MPGRDREGEGRPSLEAASAAAGSDPADGGAPRARGRGRGKDVMGETSKRHRQTASLRGARLLRPYSAGLAMVVALLGLLAPTDMALPYFLKVLVDDVFVPQDGPGRWNVLWLILPGMVVVYVARNVLFYVSRMRALRISEDLCFDLRQRVFEHLQQLSLRFYRSNQPGRVSARLMDDTFRIQSFIQDKLPTLARYLIEFQALLIIIYVVNWRLALASTLVLPLHFWVYRRFRIRIRKSHTEAQERLAVAQGNVVEKFLGMEVVKGFSAEERESRTFQEAIDASRRSKIHSQRFHFSQKVAADLLVGVGTVLLLGYGAWEVKGGRMTGGGFFMFFWYVRMLYPALLEIISGGGHLARANASVDRLYEMLDEPALERGVRADGGAEPGETSARIDFVGVGFAYSEGGPAVLDGIDLTIEPGERVAVTGPSGAGKSTLISLLPRFNDATAGQVRLGGHPVETLSLRALRGMFGFVFQNVFLFNASIYDNLRYARPDATPEDVVEACRVTGAHEFIERLSHGYDTRIGASGVELSRGEKQRITLARALVRRPRVLILDEGTASLDPVAAREIIQRILEQDPGRTVIMVTHEAELLDLVDRVVALEDGRVVFDGAPGGPEFAATRIGNGIRAPRRLAVAAATRGPERDAADRHTERPAGREPAAGADPNEAEHAAGDPPAAHPARPLTGPGAALLLAALLVPAGCMHSATRSSQIEMGEHRTSAGGLTLEADDEADLFKLADALDAIALDPAGIRTAPAAAAPAAGAADRASAAGPAQAPAAVASAPAQAAAPSGPGPAVAAVPGAPAQLSLGEAAALLAPQDIPADAVGLVTLPKLSGIEIAELVDSLMLRLQVEQRYGKASAVLADAMPAPPEAFTDAGVVVRQAEGRTSAIRFAYRIFASQPPQLWYFGVVVEDGAPVAANPDVALVGPAANELIASLQAMRSDLHVSELESKMIQLSYVDAAIAVDMLEGMGLTTFRSPTEVPDTVDFTQLPFVVKVPDPEKEDTSLIVGTETVSSASFGLSLAPSVAGKLQANALASPMTQLLVMFHPAHPDQFSRVRKILNDFVDRPARQIFVEGMVLEISDEGLRDLGVEWEINQDPIHWKFGSPQVDSGDTLDMTTDTANFWRVFKRDFLWQWSLRIRALIREGKAEILSRPSVLTINNRQSTIRVGTDIPIATSQESSATISTKVAFTFQYLPTGIMLNIRPRISEDGSEVSMLIDTIVSAQVPGADLEIRSATGEVLASAPTVATRRVQTYARIPNNTPFIIGGLVNRQESTILDKVPLLGDLPFIGAAFRAERTETEKREVIIVLTPYVLPEPQIVGRTLPKDEDLFDSFGHQLFRDWYRIRADDVFDLGFLFENHRLSVYRDLAGEAIAGNFRLGEEEPFKDFAGGRIPGESILVTRMIYEVVKRLGVGQQIPPIRMLVLKNETADGFEVTDLDEMLTRLGDGHSADSFFRKRRDSAVAITFTVDPESMEAGRIASEQIPRVYTVPCKANDRKEWEALLWDLNQPDEQGRLRQTILIRSNEDLMRLRRALALKRIVLINGGESQMNLSSFSVGKLLLMPELKPEQGHIIDVDVARYFFHTEHYYGATIQLIEERLRELDEALRRPDIQPLLRTDPELLPDDEEMLEAPGE